VSGKEAEWQKYFAFLSDEKLALDLDDLRIFLAVVRGLDEEPLGWKHLRAGCKSVAAIANSS